MPVVERDGVRIAYESHGSGSPILLGHSFLCSGAMWEPQVPALAARHRVLNFDLRGHGASGPVDRPCTIYDLVEDAIAVLDDAGIERAIWAGLSIGGMIALRAALTKPDRVTALILVDTDGGSETTWNRLKMTTIGLIAATVGLRPLMPQAAKQMFGSTTRRTRPALVSEWSQRFAAVHVPTALQLLSALRHRDDLLPQLASVSVPALVVVGTEDFSLPPDRSERLAAALVNARFLEIRNAGHLTSLEQPAAVTAAMEGFLNGLDQLERSAERPRA